MTANTLTVTTVSDMLIAQDGSSLWKNTDQQNSMANWEQLTTAQLDLGEIKHDVQNAGGSTLKCRRLSGFTLNQNDNLASSYTYYLNSQN